MQQMGNVETKYTTRFKYSKLHLPGLIGMARHPDMRKTPDTWIFSLKIGYTGSMKSGRYCLQYVSVSKPFDRPRLI